MVQYSPLITSHMHGTFSVAPCNFSRDKTKNDARHGALITTHEIELPGHEIVKRGGYNYCHASLIYVESNATCSH